MWPRILGLHEFPCGLGGVNLQRWELRASRAVRPASQVATWLLISTRNSHYDALQAFNSADFGGPPPRPSGHWCPGKLQVGSESELGDFNHWLGGLQPLCRMMERRLVHKKMQGRILRACGRTRNHCSKQVEWLWTEQPGSSVRKFLNVRGKYKHILVISGNHDFWDTNWRPRRDDPAQSLSSTLFKLL